MKKITTTERYDKDGKLIERIVVTEETDTGYQRPNTQPYIYQYPAYIYQNTASC